jgi:HEAT repeat protein
MSQETELQPPEFEGMSLSQRAEARRLEELADAFLAEHGDAPTLADVSPADARAAELPFRDTPVDALMQDLMGPGDAIDPERLRALSDLTHAESAMVIRDWALVPVERRRAAIAYLVELAEDDLHLHLGRILRIALGDPDAIIRLEAVRGLWEDVSADLVDPLLQMLRADPSADVREAAAEALGAYVLAGELDEFDAAMAFRIEEALLAILTDERTALEVRRRALESMAYSGEVGMRQLIEDAYYAPEEEMRVSALRAMGRSADVRWRGLVRAELQNPSPVMRLEAAAACGELAIKTAVQELIRLLSDDELAVRLAAIAALGQIGGKQAQEALQAMRNSDEELEVEAADLALEELIFFAEEGDALFEEEDEPDDWERDRWDFWYEFDDDDLGAYEE